MYKIASFFCVFLFFACSNDDNNINSKQEVVEEIIQIEQSDAKVQLNDANVPLPVDEANEDEFDKCVACHKMSEFSAMNKEIFLNKINEFQKNKKSKEHILNDKQINMILKNIYN